MKKVFAITLAFSLISVVSIPAQASTKPGAVCSSLGTTYQDLKCVKSGNKKIWIVEKFTPWTTKFNLGSMSNASQQNFSAWIKSYKDVGGVEYYNGIQDSSILKSYLYSSKAVEAINPEAKVVVANTNESAKQMLDKLGLPYILNNGNVCYQSPGLIGCNSFQNVAIVITNNNSNQIFNQSVIAHENFHSVQGYLGKLSVYRQRLIPSWFEEGSAEYFGYMSYANANNVKYLYLRSFGNNGPSITKNLEDYATQQSYPYDVGRVAVEYLVASKGFQAVVDVFADYGNGIDFETSFEKRFDISLKKFYTIFNTTRNSVSGLVN